MIFVERLVKVIIVNGHAEREEKVQLHGWQLNDVNSI